MPTSPGRPGRPERRQRLRPARPRTRLGSRHRSRPVTPTAATAEDETGRGGGGLLRTPATWIVGIVAATAAVTFQDVLSATLNAVLPLDRVADQVAPQDAIDVVSVRDVRAYGTSLIRPPAPDEAEVLAALGSSTGWGEQLGVVDVGQSQWLITLEGRGSQQVRITDIVPRIEGGACSDPLDGSVVEANSEGGEDVVGLHSAIDSADPRLRRHTVSGTEEEPYFTGLGASHITLDRNESIGLMMHASATEGYCRWHYQISYEVAGSTETMLVHAPNGKPFELTAPLTDPADYDAAYLSPVDACTTDWQRVTADVYARLQKQPGCLR